MKRYYDGDEKTAGDRKMEKIRFCRIALGLILVVFLVLSLCRCDSATRIATDLESAVPAAFTSVEEPLPFTCQKIP